MRTNEKIVNEKFLEERALFHGEDLQLDGCVFEQGESPLKESRNITAKKSLFRWKYPFWYAKHIDLEEVTFFDGARAGVWYTDHFKMKDAIVEAPKNFRRCDDIFLENVTIPNALETLWNCKNVTLKDVSAQGPYFAMGCENVTADGLNLVGDYSFDGVKNMEIRNSHLASKDAFWNSENVTVYDSFITGEYLGWNAKNLTLINCTIESLQGMCYVENLVMKNCRLINTTLAFEYSSCDAEIKGEIDSVLNPGSGMIRAERIKHLVIQPDMVDPSNTEILCDNVDEKLDSPDTLW